MIPAQLSINGVNALMRILKVGVKSFMRLEYFFAICNTLI